MGKVLMSGIVPKLEKPSTLPAGYTALEYLETNGSQYIDTGYTPNSNTRVVLDAYNLSTSSGWTFGVWSSASSLQYAFSCLSTYSFRYGSKNVALTTVPVGPLKVDFNKNAYNLNGTAGTLDAQTFTCAYPMYLFAINAAGSVSSGKFTGKTYSCQIYDNGTLVRDFVPCTNDVGLSGLYDMVNEKFYPLLPVAINDMSWEAVRAISDSGQAANYFAVGDTKNITINGKVGQTTFSNLSIDVFIIGIDHNSSVEGTNRIHFQIGKINGVDVALTDSQYGYSTSTAGYFAMTTGDTNLGWKNCNMRTTVLGSDTTAASPRANTLLAALPADLRAVMKSVAKYSANEYDPGNYASSVSKLTEYLPLLAEFEVHGTRYSANETEQKYQAQYAYYAAGNSKKKFKHNATGTGSQWFLRSRTVANVSSTTGIYGYRQVQANGVQAGLISYYSAGVSPLFCV